MNIKHTTLETKLLSSSFNALAAIRTHHQAHLTHAECEIVEQAYMSCGSMLGLQNEAERGMTVRVNVETVVQTGASLKAERTEMALEQAYAAFTLKFRKPLNLTHGLSELVEDAAQALLTGRAL